MIFDPYPPCPETHYTDTEANDCEKEAGHEGSHVYTVWHLESYVYAGITHYESVPDYPFYWDTELACTENIHCAPFYVHPLTPDSALLDLLMHLIRVHDMDPLTALDVIENESTAHKVKNGA